jgi:ATP/maltotriose-dependent transcriptional regulator MalT
MIAYNEVRDQQKPSLHISKRWTKPKKLSTKQVNRLLAKYAHKESDYTEHVMYLTIESIRAIASIRHANVDMSEEAIPNELIKIAINTLNSDSITSEERQSTRPLHSS